MMVKFLVNGYPDIKGISLVHVYRLEFNTFIDVRCCLLASGFRAAVIELVRISYLFLSPTCIDLREGLPRRIDHSS